MTEIVFGELPGAGLRAADEAAIIGFDRSSEPGTGPVRQVEE